MGKYITGTSVRQVATPTNALSARTRGVDRDGDAAAATIEGRVQRTALDAAMSGRDRRLRLTLDRDFRGSVPNLSLWKNGSC
jgi:hypothetical protein